MTEERPAIKAVDSGEGDDGPWNLDVLIAPYGYDQEGQRFSEATEFMVKNGDVRPVVYAHGDNPWGTKDFIPSVIGKARIGRRDAQGLWATVALDKASAYAKRIWESAKASMARASSGAVQHLVRVARGGEILSWPIGEVSMMDLGTSVHKPAHQLAMASIKSLYEDAGMELPEALAEDPKEVEPSAEQHDDSNLSKAVALTATVAAHAYLRSRKAKQDSKDKES